MRIYSRYILPGLIDWACSQPSGTKMREKVIPLARGRVLEVGIGSGKNLPYYRGQEVEHLTAIDPLEELWERKQVELTSLDFEVDFIKGSAQRIPFDDESFDTVVSTSTLCSIKDVEEALKEMYRVLKPGGKLLFEEHGAAPDVPLARRQNLLNPVWKRIGGGCNLNRNIPVLLEEAGFLNEGLNEGYQDGWKPTSYHFWGFALKSESPSVRQRIPGITGRITGRRILLPGWMAKIRIGKEISRSGIGKRIGRPSSSDPWTHTWERSWMQILMVSIWISSTLTSIMSKQFKHWRNKYLVCMKLYPILFSMAKVLLLISCNNNSTETLEQRIDRVSRAEMESVCQLLGHDLYEGRAPGTRGGELAEITMQGLFKFMDLDPGTDNGYFQPFVMKGFSNKGFTVRANGLELAYKEDIVGTFSVEEEQVDMEADVVFVGFGVSTEIWGWDDYKDVDVNGKIVLTRVNDPGLINPDIFEGSTLTYFGRWTCHIEEAARRGAAGILLIHSDETAGYDWNVVKNSWSGEELFIDSDLQNKLKFRGWIRESSLRKVLEESGDGPYGFDLDKLYEDASTADFQPVDLGFKVAMSGSNSFREVNNRNVVAEIPGKSDQRIVLSAHIDHLGMDSGKEGDQIYNGAIDNGTAVGAMMVVAKILKEFQDELHYSVTILGCNAEESGLLGSKYYAENTDRSAIIANINFESTPVWEASKSIMGIGARFSDFEEMIKGLAADDGLEYSTFSLSNQGLFYRSDQFSFARLGIPSVWISAGEDQLSGATSYTEFWGKDYHTVRDEFNPEWELEGMKQTIRYALLLIDHINSTQVAPEMKDGLPFPLED